MFISIWWSVVFCSFFFFKQKTAYEMRISDWSSDVCSSDLDDVRLVLAQDGIARPSRSIGEFADDGVRPSGRRDARGVLRHERDRKSVVSGKSVSVRVDLGGRSIIKKKKNV